MNALSDLWTALETPLDAEPIFPFEAPDTRRDWTEIQRQVEFRRLMKMLAPSLYVRANPNAGKRNPLQASREGIVGGVFDMSIIGAFPLYAEVEFKGWTASKGKGGKVRYQSGSLSSPQIDHGNRMTRQGFPVAMFFDPLNAIDWLRAQGFPIRPVHSSNRPQ